MKAVVATLSFCLFWGAALLPAHAQQQQQQQRQTGTIRGTVTDAIAGVVNVVLEEGNTPLEATVQASQYAPNEFESDGRTLSAAGNYGLSLAAGTLDLSLEYRNRQPTNRAGADSRDQIAEGDADVVNADNEVVEKNNPVEQPNHHWGDGFAELFMGFLNARYSLLGEGSAELYAFGGATYRQGRSQGFRRRAIDGRNWPAIYPEGYLPEFAPDVVDVSGVVGVEGALSGWNYDLSGSYGRNNYEFNMQNTLNVTLGPGLYHTAV